MCRLIKQGGLGVLHIQSMNTALLKKWVDRIMGPQDDLVISVLRDNSGRRLNWDSQSAPIKGA